MSSVLPSLDPSGRKLRIVIGGIVVAIPTLLFFVFFYEHVLMFLIMLSISLLLVLGASLFWTDDVEEILFFVGIAFVAAVILAMMFYGF